MIKIAASNLRDRFNSAAVLTVVLVISLWITGDLLRGLMPFIAEESLYRRAGLGRVITVTVSEEQEERVKSTAAEAGAVWLGDGYSYRLTSDGYAQLQPVGTRHFELLEHGMRNKLSDLSAESLAELDIEGYPAVVCRSLSGYYELGETYTEYVGMLNPTAAVTFTVVGILSSDRAFVPAYMSLSENGESVYIITDDGGEAFERALDRSFALCAESQEEAEALAGSLSELDGVYSAYAFADVYAELWHDSRLEQAGVPMILVFVSSLLCLAAMASQSMLSALEFERKYAICRVCGASRAKRLMIRLLSDAAPVVSAPCVTVMILLMQRYGEYGTLTATAAGMESAPFMFVQTAVMFAVSEAIALAATHKMSAGGERSKKWVS